MIQFSVSLTPNQIAVLRAIREDADRGDDSGFGLSHFISGVRLLLNERLVTHEDTGGPNRWRYGITEKGRLLLRVIELDVIDFAETVSLQAERLQQAKMQASIDAAPVVPIEVPLIEIRHPDQIRDEDGPIDLSLDDDTEVTP